MNIVSFLIGNMFVALVAKGIPSGGFVRRQGVLTLTHLVVRSMGLSTVPSLSASVSSLIQDPSLIPMIEEGTPTFDVRDPSNPDSVLAKIPIMGQTDAQTAIQRSAEALPSWRDGTTASFRASLLQKWSTLINENLEDLSILMTMETGKPMAESRGEVNYARSFLDYYAGEAIRSSGAGGGLLLPSPFAISDGSPRGQVMVIQQAVGVTGLITPWNFPSAMITRKVGPALAAGCTAVIKPSELTPLSAIALKTLADRAGIPPSVIQLV
jgi:succinate-semialdehyde dehydrogenase / glutarate-semialdehyde dehydrogenase